MLARRSATVLACAVLVLLSGCAPLKQLATRLPDLACPLVKRQALEYGRDYRAKYVPGLLAMVTGDPVADEVTFFAYIDSLEFKVVYRDKEGGPATTLPGLVILPKNYPTRRAPYRTALLLHETSHALWEREIGVVQSAKDYAIPGFRIGVEFPSYEAQGKALELYGVSARGLRRHYKRVAPNLLEKYWLEPFTTLECIQEIQAELWTAPA